MSFYIFVLHFFCPQELYCDGEVCTQVFKKKGKEWRGTCISGEVTLWWKASCTITTTLNKETVLLTRFEILSLYWDFSVGKWKWENVIPVRAWVYATRWHYYITVVRCSSTLACRQMISSAFLNHHHQTYLGVFFGWLKKALQLRLILDTEILTQIDAVHLFVKLCVIKLGFY